MKVWRSGSPEQVGLREAPHSLSIAKIGPIGLGQIHHSQTVQDKGGKFAVVTFFPECEWTLRQSCPDIIMYCRLFVVVLAKPCKMLSYRGETALQGAL